MTPDPNLPDNLGPTPLSLTTEEGHFTVVHALLGHKTVDANRANRFGRTPLLKAADNG